MKYDGEWKALEHLKDGHIHWEVIRRDAKYVHTILADNLLEANAHLIAKAPRMLEVLRKLCEVGWNTDDESYDEVQEVVEDAYQIISELGGDS